MPRSDAQRHRTAAQEGIPLSSNPDRKLRTPFADAVLGLRAAAASAEEIVSFHALPWSQGRSLADAGELGDKYRRLFGEAYLQTDVTYAGGALDSYFWPSASLDLAQQLAADAFGANQTFFVTAGTTLANQVAFDALAGRGRRILVDRTAHQSIHVAVAQSPATIDYAPASERPQSPGQQPLLDVPRLLRMVTDAAEIGQPYDTIVLAGSSYDGVLYNLYRIMTECLATSPGTSFIVDEAWSAINRFHPVLRSLTALDAAARISAAGGAPAVLVTQSAHKSMSAARQGSYLHVFGDSELIGRVAATLYGRHTTSPSVPILASLDLARAHAQADGERLIQRAFDLAAQVHEAIDTDGELSGYRTSRNPITDLAHRRYFSADPTKVLIDVSGLGLTGEQVRLRLFHDYGVYVSRTLPHGFLLNLHIGITASDVQRLLDALRSLARRALGHVVGRELAGGLGAGPGSDGIVNQLLIAYPPGVPLAVPGDRWTDRLRQQVAASRRSGADVYVLSVGASRLALEAREEVS
ncbi:aminotransferase class I/II-fold pyridoxal phosphate-dependent enzyme [Jatrophihabitans sp. DSM 45814]